MSRTWLHCCWHGSRCPPNVAMTAMSFCHGVEDPTQSVIRVVPEGRRLRPEKAQPALPGLRRGASQAQVGDGPCCRTPVVLGGTKKGIESTLRFPSRLLDSAVCHGM